MDDLSPRLHGKAACQGVGLETLTAQTAAERWSPSSPERLARPFWRGTLCRAGQRRGPWPRRAGQNPEQALEQEQEQGLRVRNSKLVRQLCIWIQRNFIKEMLLQRLRRAAIN